MMKRLLVLDENTGEELESIQFDGGYNIIYSNNTDDGGLRKIRKLDNGKFGHKHWIKSYRYRPIVEKLVEKFKEIAFVKPSLILFIEDMDWEPGSNSTKRPWIARIKMTNKEFADMTGYQYILETRSYYTEKMQAEQLIALLYHEVRHIDHDGSLKQHDIEDWSNMVATLGTDWATTQATIKNLLDEDFDTWNELEPVAKQLNMFSGLRAVR